MNMFHMDWESENTMKLSPCDRYNDKNGDNIVSMYLMPKQFVECSKNELLRGLKLTGKTA